MFLQGHKGSLGKIVRKEEGGRDQTRWPSPGPVVNKLFLSVPALNLGSLPSCPRCAGAYGAGSLRTQGRVGLEGVKAIYLRGSKPGCVSESSGELDMGGCLAICIFAKHSRRCF